MARALKGDDLTKVPTEELLAELHKRKALPDATINLRLPPDYKPKQGMARSEGRYL